MARRQSRLLVPVLVCVFIRFCCVQNRQLRPARKRGMSYRVEFRMKSLGTGSLKHLPKKLQVNSGHLWFLVEFAEERAVGQPATPTVRNVLSCLSCLRRPVRIDRSV